MAIGDKEFLGKPISKKLSDYLKKHTDIIDRANVSVKTNVGTSSIRDVVYRYRALSEDNSKVVVELMKIAIKNCTFSIEKTSKAKEDLEKMVQESKEVIPSKIIIKNGINRLFKRK